MTIVGKRVGPSGRTGRARESRCNFFGLYMEATFQDFANSYMPT